MAGAGLERQLRVQARKHGLRYLGPNSLGVIRTDIGLNAAAARASRTRVASRWSPSPGRCARPDRLGALAPRRLLERGLHRRGPRRGPRRDPRLPGARPGDGQHHAVSRRHRTRATLHECATAAARVKPVVVMKAARHVSAVGDTAFHTGSLVGADDVFDAAMRRAGVLRIRDFSELYTAAATLGAGVRVRGKRLAIVANAGGPGTIAADRAQDRGLQIAALGAASLARLDTELPPAARAGNPVYVRPDVDDTQFAAAAASASRIPRWTCCSPSWCRTRSPTRRHRRLAHRDCAAGSQTSVRLLDGRRHRGSEPGAVCGAPGAELHAPRDGGGCGRRHGPVRRKPAVAAAGAGARGAGVGTRPRPCPGSDRRGTGGRTQLAQSRGIEGGPRGVRHSDGAQPAGARRRRGRGARPRSGFPGGDEDPLAGHPAQDRRRRRAPRARRRARRARRLRAHDGGTWRASGQGPICKACSSSPCTARKTAAN